MTQTVTEGAGAPDATIFDRIRVGVDGHAESMHRSMMPVQNTGFTLAVLKAKYPRPLWRLDQATRLQVRLEGALLQSATLEAVLGGANALAVFTTAGEWEVLQFTTAEAIAEDCWELSGLLRGQCGSDAAMAALNQLPARSPNSDIAALAPTAGTPAISESGLA